MDTAVASKPTPDGVSVLTEIMDSSYIEQWNEDGLWKGIKR